MPGKYSEMELPKEEKGFEDEFAMDDIDSEESGSDIAEALAAFSKEEIEEYLASMDEEPSEEEDEMDEDMEEDFA